MGISAKPIGKFRGILRKIEIEEEKKKEEEVKKRKDKLNGKWSKIKEETE